jgi:hypothetical protein
VRAFEFKSLIKIRKREGKANSLVRDPRPVIASGIDPNITTAWAGTELANEKKEKDRGRVSVHVNHAASRRAIHTRPIASGCPITGERPAVRAWA